MTDDAKDIDQSLAEAFGDIDVLITYTPAVDFAGVFSIEIPVYAASDDRALQHLANRLAVLLGRLSRKCGVQPSPITMLTLETSLNHVFKKETK